MIVRHFHRLAAATILGVAACVPAQEDLGGKVGDYASAALKAKAAHQEVRLTGHYESAAILKLSSGSGVCVSPDASFGVHEIRDVKPGSDDYWGGSRSEEGTAYVRWFLPGCVRKLFDSRHAFSSGFMTYFTGADILKACPKIRQCAH
jgi:hypothetical protein